MLGEVMVILSETVEVMLHRGDDIVATNHLKTH